MPNQHSPFWKEAHACRIYGYAKARDWKISATELARVLKIRTQMVQTIIEERGWPVDGFAASKTRQAEQRTLTRDSATGVRPVDMEFV